MSWASPRRVALAMTCLVENFLMIPLSQALAETALASNQPLGRAFGTALRRLPHSAIVLGILGGLPGSLPHWLWDAPQSH
jgi:hypothetical protein